MHRDEWTCVPGFIKPSLDSTIQLSQTSLEFITLPLKAIQWNLRMDKLVHGPLYVILSNGLFSGQQVGKMVSSSMVTYMH